MKSELYLSHDTKGLDVDFMHNIPVSPTESLVLLMKLFLEKNKLAVFYPKHRYCNFGRIVPEIFLVTSFNALSYLNGFK